ncbi:MAG: hypothetical protein NTW87_31935 [Planctomycetota bacterium]|nr:hypothetical protein [Planctomycetota bacterium]
MADGMNPARVTPAAAKAARIASSALRIAALLFVTSIALAFVGGKLSVFFLISLCFIVIPIAALLGIVAGLTRVGISVLCESQMRLSEILVTVLAAGAISAVLTHCIEAYASQWREHRALCAVAAVGTFLLLGIGSAWGLGVIQRLQVQEPWRRSKFLACGWLLAVGAAGLTAYLLLTLVYLAGGGQGGMPDSVRPCLGYSAALMIPGVFVEIATLESSGPSAR